jgi:two-component system response regulator
MYPAAVKLSPKPAGAKKTVLSASGFITKAGHLRGFCRGLQGPGKILVRDCRVAIIETEKEESIMAQKTKGSAAEPVEVLLVEDNPGDVELTKRRLEESAFDLSINIAEDGEVALAYLRKEGEYASAPRPDVILLDLKMPKMDGYEVLAELDADPALKDIEVMILTSSHGEMSDLFRKGFLPSRYGLKPIDVDQFDRVVRDVTATVEEEPRRRWWWPFGNR